MSDSVVLDNSLLSNLSHEGTVNFNSGWKFCKGDLAFAFEYLHDDSGWELLNVPHDWIIKETPDSEYNGNEGFFPGGTAWYRKHFIIPEEDIDKTIIIEFDCIYHRSDVYVNGIWLGHCSYGYTPLYYDLTPYIKFGLKNVIAVKVNTGGGTRWYAGGGIIRHVYLHTLNKLHVSHFGTFIKTTGLSESFADINITTNINNSYSAPVQFTLQTCIFNVDGNFVTRIESNHNLLQNSRDEFNQKIVLPNPELWDIYTPYLYYAITEIILDNVTVDRYKTTFGIRTLEWNTQKGLLLNGRQIKVKGGNIHDDLGMLGNAYNSRGWERRLDTLKNMGFNEIRASHNLRPREMMDLFDRMGFLLMDEAIDKWHHSEIYPDFDKNWEREISSMVYRDRNHPSVYLWSVGNEVDEQLTPKEFSKFYTMLAEWIHRNDPTRKVTCACQYNIQENLKIHDIAGANYLDGFFEEYRKQNPKMLIISTESLLYYRYLNQDLSGLNPVDENPWLDVIRNNHVVGSNVWAAIEYLGETWGSGWPAKGMNGAIVDLCGFKKSPTAFYERYFKDDPVVRIIVCDDKVKMHERTAPAAWYFPNMANHWTHPDIKDGTATIVKTVTNCETVELYLNGAYIGKKHKVNDDDREISWNIDYLSGEIKAVGLIGSEIVCEEVLKTAGSAAKIQLTADRKVLKSDKTDIIHIEVRITDSNGIMVPSAEHEIKFTVEGAAHLLATGNADLMGDFRQSKAFSGQMLAIIQSNGDCGLITVTSSAEGLENETLVLFADNNYEIVPYLFGMTLEDAENKLAKTGLYCGNIEYEYNTVVPEGKILWQYPPFDTSVPAKTPVNIVISRGQISHML